MAQRHPLGWDAAQPPRPAALTQRSPDGTGQPDLLELSCELLPLRLLVLQDGFRPLQLHLQLHANTANMLGTWGRPSWVPRALGSLTPAATSSGCAQGPLDPALPGTSKRGGLCA